MQPRAKWIGIAATLTLTLVLATTLARAGSDLDVFIAGQSVQPNVLILFDNSGSMSDGIPYDAEVTYAGPATPTTIYDRCQVFNTNCSCKTTQTTWKVSTQCGFVDVNNDGQDDRAPSYKKIGNRRNFDGLPNPPKMAVAKSVVDGLLQDPANAQVRFGLMVLNGSYLPSDYTSASQTSTYHNDKSILKAQLGTDHETLRGIVNGLVANAGTPLAPRLIAAARYYKNDGYFTSVADPVQYLCQRNYVVLMTDGRPQVEGVAFGNCGSGFSNPYCGSNASGSFNYIESWLGVPYDKDGDGRDPDPGHFTPPAGCTPNASPDEEPCEYHNGGSDYLDDVTKVLLDSDLRPGMDGQQVLVTYTIGFTIGNSLLQRAAGHGGGTYFTANTSDELADAFRATLNAIVTETESFVAPVVPVSQTTRTQSGDRLYIALFRPRDGSLRWPGNLKKYQVSPEGQLLDAAGAAATNSDGEILPNARSYWDTTASGSAVSRGGVGEILLTRATPRVIYSNTTAAPADGSGLALTGPAHAFTIANTNLTQAMLGAASSTERGNIIDYIHGIDVYDDDEDSNVTEKRAWILGDTIHSVPLVVNYTASDAAIFIGANDGMLHAFDDATGSELWAYIPDELQSRLRLLTPGASGSHQFYVDSSPKLLTTSDGKKIIVFGFGRGGRAYYGLDVTSKTAPKLLWKVTATGDFDELGQAWSEPAFIKTSGGVDAFLIGGGYDPYFDDPTHVSPNASGYGRAIFAVNARTGARIARIKPTGMDYAIPSNVAALDFNSDGKLDRAYVGDLGGNMWSIDSELNATKLFSAPSVSGSTLYKIYYAPDVVRDRGFLSVFFGTGDRSNPLETTVVNRIYAIKDDGTSNLNEGDLIDVTDRVEQNGSDEEATLKDDLQSSRGWFIMLNQRPGEKVLASPAAFFSVFFSTFVPVAGVCNAGGDARVYELNYETGGVPDSKAADPDGDGPEEAPTVARDDRFILIGKSIPTELTVTLQRATASGFVASSGNVDRLPLPELPNNVTPLSWRECSTGVPCR